MGSYLPYGLRRHCYQPLITHLKYEKQYNFILLKRYTRLTTHRLIEHKKKSTRNNGLPIEVQSTSFFSAEDCGYSSHETKWGTVAGSQPVHCTSCIVLVLYTFHQRTTHARCHWFIYSCTIGLHAFTVISMQKYPIVYIRSWHGDPLISFSEVL